MYILVPKEYGICMHVITALKILLFLYRSTALSKSSEELLGTEETLGWEDSDELLEIVEIKLAEGQMKPTEEEFRGWLLAATRPDDRRKMGLGSPSLLMLRATIYKSRLT